MKSRVREEPPPSPHPVRHCGYSGGGFHGAAMKFGIYNARQSMTLQRLFFGLLALVLSVTPVYAATPEAWAAPAARLAKEIANISGPGTVVLTLKNQSTISTDEVAAIRRAIEAQLRVNGVQIRSAENAATTVAMTLSENLQGWLWVAEVTQGSETKAALVSVARAGNVASAGTGPAMTLKRTLVYSQTTSILDFATIHAGNDTHLVVLDAANVSLYKSTGTKYELEQAFPIMHSRAFPRDLRGRLTLGKDHLFDAYLPGVICSSNAATPITVNCHESDDPWPLGSQKALFNSARDFFTGALFPGIGKPVSPFFTGGELPRSNYTLWIFTGVDGVVRESDGMNERRVPGSISGDWGSDLAGVRTACGLGTQLLVTSAGDVVDSIRAYEVPDREPVLVSAALGFDGPIMALWTSMDGTTANAVVHNTTGGRYEAYNVSVACNQ
ncbi:hypothetical protein Acid345_1731 [Candidatus Koribacter versatilis Ellin345]|uniref:Uncharacterized protein n=2 Tax=Candidatus Korobacter versatilis TaxID=658062 RepID=Q1IQW8_KORVE|nr:hypothetical protein Acid345_1731 [Candidatus Koribacter versatilis Ellin345]